MKQFVKTIAGKTIVFIVCVLSICILCASAISAAVMIGTDFYTRDRDSIYDDFMEDRMRNDAYNAVWNSLAENSEDRSVLDEKDGIIIQVLDSSGEIANQSESADQIKNWEHSYRYGILRNEEGYATDVYYAGSPEFHGEEYYTVNISIDRKSEKGSLYGFFYDVIGKAYDLRYAVYYIGVICLLLSIASFVTLMSVAGRRNDSDELCPGSLNRVPFDVLLAGFMLATVLYAWFIIDIARFSDAVVVVFMVIGMIVLLCVFIGLCMSMAVRIKQKNLIKGTLTYGMTAYLIKALRKLLVLAGNTIRFLWKTCMQLPLVWKTMLITFGLMFIDFLFLMDLSSDYVTFWFLKNMILLPCILYIVLNMKRLQKGGQALAAGDLSYHVDTNRMFYDFKRHGEDLNSIAKGMTLAVNKQMKSERMKTELITNVSHDIKTPLTSIINYADLIGKEETDNPKISEYSEVLLRQSERLKRLIDDLVEASKASTGNLEVNLTSCECSTFIEQAAGEYEDKLKKAKLNLITALPQEELWIMADGRRMWRIFDNLMNNICKYALQDTRVYLSLEKAGSDAVFTFKNTSRDQLNISEEELMERFTRGDASRNTEGNGLGLSIARSMAELQGGKLELSIDGDLFKAILSFPLIDQH